MSNLKLLFFAAIALGMITAGPSSGQNSESSGITWSFDDGNETAISADQEPSLKPVVPNLDLAAEPLAQSPLPSASYWAACADPGLYTLADVLENGG